MAMDDTAFWKLIAHVDAAALESEDEDGAVLPLQQVLESLTELELEAFDELLARQLYNIDGKAYADNAGESANSDDGFLYARCYVVARGRDYYERVKQDPRQMPKTLAQWCESLLYVHRYAWARLTGRDVSESPFVASVSYESGSNRALWDEV